MGCNSILMVPAIFNISKTFLRLYLALAASAHQTKTCIKSRTGTIKQLRICLKLTRQNNETAVAQWFSTKHVHSSDPNLNFSNSANKSLIMRTRENDFVSQPYHKTKLWDISGMLLTTTCFLTLEKHAKYVKS